MHLEVAERMLDHIMQHSRHSRQWWRDALAGYVFISPWLLGFLIWTAGPMAASFAISLMEWEVVIPPFFIAFKNYVNLLKDPLFTLSLSNTAYYTFIGVPLQLMTALFLAMSLNLKVRGISIYRTMYYLPSVTPTVASAMLWLWIFNPEFGIANAALRVFGIPKQLWLLDPNLAKPCFIIMSLWGVGGSMVIFLAGLQGVPIELYEAASIDGANAWHRFHYVTLPMITPIIFFNFIMGIIGSFQIFTSAFIMTDGGPQNKTLFSVLYLYRNGFQYFKMGYASALAWVIFLIILSFTLLQLKFSKRWVYYETELKM